MSDRTATDLTQRGLAAARVGDVEDARRLLTEATQKTPNNVEAWLGLAGVVQTLEEKETCFNEVLALDPENREAEAGLALVKQKLAAQPQPAAPGTEEVVVCYRHPQIETSLRCNRCNKPICPKCARRTPVGFRCPDCIREQENKFYSGGNVDYLIAAAIAFPLSLIAAWLFTFILGGFGFWVIFIGIFVAPAIAGFIAEAVRWGVRKRRSRYLGHVAAGTLILATAPFLWSMLPNFFGLLAPGILLVLGTTTILARLR